MGIEPIVREAAAEVVSTNNICAVPFPGMGNQDDFRAATQNIVKNLPGQSQAR
jgi:hypothetical protein